MKTQTLNTNPFEISQTGTTCFVGVPQILDDFRLFYGFENTLKISEVVPKIKLSYDDLMEIERAAYEKHKEKWVASHEGKYVAFYQGEALDEDADFSALAERIYSLYIDLPIYIPYVSREKVRGSILSPTVK